MKRIFNIYIIAFFIFCSFPCYSQALYPSYADSTKIVEFSNRLSNEYMPVIGVWMWGEKEFQNDGYKRMIDQACEHSPFNLLIPFLRFPDKEVVNEKVHDQVKLAAIYSNSKGVQLVPDLDVRSARRAFQKAYPDELQQMLRIKEVSLSALKAVDVIVPSIDLNDHYSGGTITHHISLKGSLLRVYAYYRTPEGINSKSVKDITKNCRLIFSTKDSVKVEIPSQISGNNEKSYACVMVSFTHLYPDIFGSHLMDFQKKIIKQYGDIPLAGVCKDEWGYPPYYPRFFKSGFYDYWYSPYHAKAYAQKTSGRDFLSDCMLMSLGMNGKDAERQMAVNQLNEMTRDRNKALEEDFYNTVKKVFGPNAAVTVHSTWWPFPDKCEYKKNGLDWWVSKRDWAQTDEVVPFAVRTALCKKWGSSIWYNMYYKEDLASQIWSSALAGGRIDYLEFTSLSSSEIMQAENRVRLLNYISKSPLNCPVAVIFGQANAMNWAGNDFDNVGMELVDSLWHKGYPTDLIPTTEIENGSLHVDSVGSVWYGKQRYAAVVLYHPQFEKQTTADFFKKVNFNNTALFNIGEWTRDFNGRAIKGTKLLPETMSASTSIQDVFIKVLDTLNQKSILSQTPATGVLDNRFFKLRDFNHSSYMPATKGFCRLIDGTVIHISGTDKVSGDTIRESFKINDFDVTLDAIGVAATRLDENGNLIALAAGGLKYIKSGDFEIKLNNRIDMALWKDFKGKWKGVVQSENQDIPKELLLITKDWIRLNNPTPVNK
ncbi:MAG: hypothetical protein LLF95_09020 [Bacteroidales bacterium]|nr:hypothetical protein [Bacteroidales bacterium]